MLCVTCSVVWPSKPLRISAKLSNRISLLRIISRTPCYRQKTDRKIPRGPLVMLVSAKISLSFLSSTLHYECSLRCFTLTLVLCGMDPISYSPAKRLETVLTSLRQLRQVLDHFFCALSYLPPRVVTLTSQRHHCSMSFSCYDLLSSYAIDHSIECIRIPNASRFIVVRSFVWCEIDAATGSWEQLTALDI